MESLALNDKGDFAVTTLSGTTYLVSLGDNSAEITRLQDTGSEDSLQMRKDANALPLVGIFRCDVGASGVFMIYGVADDPSTFTQRITSPITEIRQLVS
jgi:hypothetical protein